MPRKLERTWTYNGFTEQLPTWCDEVNAEFVELRQEIKELKEKILDEKFATIDKKLDQLLNKN